MPHLQSPETSPFLWSREAWKHKEASCCRHCTPAIMQAFVPRPLDSPGVPASKLAVLSAPDQDASECTFPSGAFWCASSRNESQIKEWEFLFITSFFHAVPQGPSISWESVKRLGYYLSRRHKHLLPTNSGVHEMLTSGKGVCVPKVLWRKGISPGL